MTEARKLKPHGELIVGEDRCSDHVRSEFGHVKDLDRPLPQGCQGTDQIRVVSMMGSPMLRRVHATCCRFGHRVITTPIPVMTR